MAHLGTSMNSAGASIPWVWADENSSSPFGSAPGAFHRGKSGVSVRTQRSVSRGALPFAVRDSIMLELDGIKAAGHARSRKSWMKNLMAQRVSGVDARSRTALNVSSQSDSLAGSSETAPERLKLKLPVKTAKRSALGDVPGNPNKHSRSDVQPFLGPELKKSLAKQGMRMQKLDLNADEWDTPEVEFMLGKGFANKQVSETLSLCTELVP